MDIVCLLPYLSNQDDNVFRGTGYATTSSSATSQKVKILPDVGSPGCGVVKKPTKRNKKAKASAVDEDVDEKVEIVFADDEDERSDDDETTERVDLEFDD